MGGGGRAEELMDYRVISFDMFYVLAYQWESKVLREQVGRFIGWMN